METVGFVGVGKIGMSISQNLIKSGYRVVGYRRSALDEFVKIGGVPARSAAEVGAQADVVFSCLPSDKALEDVVHGPDGLIRSARPGQIVVELGSYPVAVKQRHVAPLAEKGAFFIDGEVAGTPGMVLARKGVVFLAGDEQACRTIEPGVCVFPGGARGAVRDTRPGGGCLRLVRLIFGRVRRGEPRQADQQSDGLD